MTEDYVIKMNSMSVLACCEAFLSESTLSDNRRMELRALVTWRLCQTKNMIILTTHAYTSVKINISKDYTEKGRVSKYFLCDPSKNMSSI